MLADLKIGLFWLRSDSWVLFSNRISGKSCLMYFSRRIVSLRLNIGIIFDVLQILKNEFDGILNIAAIKFNSLKLPTFLELFLKFFILFKSESPGAIMELIPSHLKAIFQSNLNRIAGVILENNILEKIIDVFLFIE